MFPAIKSNLVPSTFRGKDLYCCSRQYILMSWYLPRQLLLQIEAQEQLFLPSINCLVRLLFQHLPHRHYHPQCLVVGHKVRYPLQPNKATSVSLILKFSSEDIMTRRRRRRRRRRRSVSQLQYYLNYIEEGKQRQHVVSTAERRNGLEKRYFNQDEKWKSKNTTTPNFRCNAGTTSKSRSEHHHTGPPAHEESTNHVKNIKSGPIASPFLDSFIICVLLTVSVFLCRFFNTLRFYVNSA